MDKASRPVRNRRHSRRAWPPGDIHRPIKRLFTPEIKRMLKDWLVRRRDNPYPSREEKKSLAIKTGLTYIQICNWFANWRRKLKNAGKEPQKKTWGHLIKTYNTSANGNVEQFSICSNDSIWGDVERSPAAGHSQRQLYNEHNLLDSEYYHHQMPQHHPAAMDYYDGYGDFAKMRINDKNNYGSYYSSSSPPSSAELMYENSYSGCGPMKKPISLSISQEQCFQISSTTNGSSKTYSVQISDNNLPEKPTSLDLFSNTKYKNHIMEKYLRGLDHGDSGTNGGGGGKKGGMELSKWLESAANFTPDKNNYIEWETAARNKNAKNRQQFGETNLNHQREELEAAEALTSLAGNYRNRLFNSHTPLNGNVMA